MQLIEELPFGLAICAANGETATLTGLSDRQMRLRTHGAEPLSSLAVRFLTDDRASYVACPVDGWRVSHEERTRLGVLRMVDVPCPAFAKEARRALKLYTEYLRLKSLGDDEYLAHALTGCPYVDTTARSFAGQKAAWLRGAAAFSLPGDWTLALTADSFAAYRRFLSLPLDAFQREATLNLPAFARPAGRICIGNAGCPRLFPDRPLLSKLLAREGTGTECHDRPSPSLGKRRPGNGTPARLSRYHQRRRALRERSGRPGARAENPPHPHPRHPAEPPP